MPIMTSELKPVNESSMMLRSISQNIAYPLGFWSAVIATAGGVVYSLVVLWVILTGQFEFPLPEPVQLIGGVLNLIFCPLLVILMSSLHGITPLSRKSLSQISLGFTLLFAISVSINRFVQLGVVRQSVTIGQVQGVEWFLAYGEHSILFGLEMMGWGWFLGMAMIFAAPLFSIGKLQTWLRWLSLLYGILGLTSAIAHLLGSPMAAIGFVAWGGGLPVITALLAVYFRRGMKDDGLSIRTGA